MAQELLYTSAPRGLKPGSRGFCTVLATQGMPAPLASAVEALSGYRAIYPPSDERAGRNPVVYSHLKMQATGRSWHVLSRIADYGLDYSQRPNKLAHHVVLDTPAEQLPGGPANLLLTSGFMREIWEGDPTLVAPKPITREQRPHSGICEQWKELTGDAGWAGVVADSFLKDPDRQVILLFEPGQDILPLIAEAISLLPPEKRWDVTFSTYFTGLATGTTCNWRGIVAGSKEATESLRNVGALRVELSLSSDRTPVRNSQIDSERADDVANPTLAPLSPPVVLSHQHSDDNLANHRKPLSRASIPSEVGQTAFRPKAPPLLGHDRSPPTPHRNTPLHESGANDTRPLHRLRLLRTLLIAIGSMLIAISSLALVLLLIFSRVTTTQQASEEAAEMTQPPVDLKPVLSTPSTSELATSSHSNEESNSEPEPATDSRGYSPQNIRPVPTPSTEQAASSQPSPVVDEDPASADTKDAHSVVNDPLPNKTRVIYPLLRITDAKSSLPFTTYRTISSAVRPDVRLLIPAWLKFTFNEEALMERGDGQTIRRFVCKQIGGIEPLHFASIEETLDLGTQTYKYNLRPLHIEVTKLLGWCQLQISCESQEPQKVVFGSFPWDVADDKRTINSKVGDPSPGIFTLNLNDIASSQNMAPPLFDLNKVSLSASSHPLPIVTSPQQITSSTSKISLQPLIDHLHSVYLKNDSYFKNKRFKNSIQLMRLEGRINKGTLTISLIGMSKFIDFIDSETKQILNNRGNEVFDRVKRANSLLNDAQQWPHNIKLFSQTKDPMDPKLSQLTTELKERLEKLLQGLQVAIANSPTDDPRLAPMKNSLREITEELASLSEFASFKAVRSSWTQMAISAIDVSFEVKDAESGPLRDTIKLIEWNSFASTAPAPTEEAKK